MFHTGTPTPRGGGAPSLPAFALLSALLVAGTVTAAPVATAAAASADRVRHLQTNLLEEGPVGYVYAKCKGECTDDDHCQGSLTCYNQPGTEKVPGCTGKRRSDTFGYCHDPADDPANNLDLVIPTDSDTLLYVGKDLALTLGRCIGDCRVDSDCRDELQCFEEEGGDAVPGCLGEREDGVAYCYDPSYDRNNYAIARYVEKLKFVDWEPNDKLDLCEGDCDKDEHCRNDLICFTAHKRETTVPGCERKREEFVDYCIDAASLPTDGTYLIAVSDRTDAKLGTCLGNCREDSDCLGDLVCYDPRGGGRVPGCTGEVDEEVSYCVRDPDGGDEPPEDETAEPTFAPTRDSTEEPTDSSTETDEPTEEPTPRPSEEPTTAEPSREPTPRPTEPTGTPTTITTSDPTPPPTTRATAPSTNTPGQPQGKVFVQLSPFVVALGFLTPDRRLGAAGGEARPPPLQQGRNLLIQETLDEEDELLNIIAQRVGDGIRSINPKSYHGLLFDVTFLEEARSSEGGEGTGTTSVSYEFNGKAIFANDPGFRPPNQDEMEVATLDALDEDGLRDRLRESDDPVLRTVESVSVYTVEGAGPDSLSEQGVPPPTNNNGGIKTGIIILVVVIVAVIALIGGAYIYTKKRNIKPTWRRPRRGGGTNVDENKQAGGGGGISSVVASTRALSKSIITSLPSPARTKSSFDSQENPTNPNFVEVDPSDLSVSNFDESSSVGASDWSFNGHAHARGYASTVDDSSAASGGGHRKKKGKGSSRMPTSGPLARASNIQITDTLNHSANQRARDYDSYSEASYSDSVTTADNMSALGEVRLGSVLQIEEGGEDGGAKDGVNGGESEEQMDFQEVWRRSRRFEVPQPSIEEQIFGTSSPDQAIHLSQSHSADAEEILTNVAENDKSAFGQESFTTPERTSRKVMSSSNPEEELPI